MTSLSKVFDARLVLAGALLACSCQHDSGAVFDDARLPSSGAGGTSAAGSSATGGEGTGGKDVGGGAGGAAGATAGTAAGGMSGTAGTASAGSAGKAGAGAAGSGGKGGGGTGGAEPGPEPMVLEIDDFEDAYVASCLQNSNFGEAETLSVDDNDGCSYAALVRPSIEQLPQGAVVSAAKLALYCENAGGEVRVTYADEEWREETVRWSTRPAAGEALGSVTCAESTTVSIDLGVAVAAWVTGAHPAHGIYLSGQTDDGTDFVSSDGEVARRPVLTVSYTLPQK